MPSKEKELHRSEYRHIYVERDSDGIAWLNFDQADSNTNVLSAIASLFFFSKVDIA